MEMVLGGPSSKKVKLTEVESREEAPVPTTEAAGPDTMATQQSAQPTPPGADEDEGGVDHISRLPDSILGDIVSFLRTDQGARTQILSTRWRHIWRSAPLNIDFLCLRYGRQELDRVVSRIISTHSGPGRCFRIPAYYLQDRAAQVDAWLRSPALDRLQELEFCHVNPPRLPPSAPPPASAFRFSRTLRVFSIGRCVLPDSIVQELHLPHLKQLALERVIISETTLQSLIARCPALECLLIYYIFGLQCARINSLGLISIGVRIRRSTREQMIRAIERAPLLESLIRSAQNKDVLPLKELVIENAPCLKRLLRVDMLDGLLVSVISAPKLETLGSIYGERCLSSTILQRMPSDSLMTAVSAVKVLSVDITCLDIRTTIELMRCFPFLEKLYIQKSIGRDLNLWKRKHRDLFKCLHIRLRIVVMQSYRGIRAQVNFATFFILNAKVLELMRFEVDAEHCTQGFLAEQSKELLLEKRASQGARFCFQTSRPLRCYSEINNVGDMDLSDPFICKRQTQVRPLQEFFLPI